MRRIVLRYDKAVVRALRTTVTGDIDPPYAKSVSRQIARETVVFVGDVKNVRRVRQTVNEEHVPSRLRFFEGKTVEAKLETAVLERIDDVLKFAGDVVKERFRRLRVRTWRRR